MTNYDWTSAPLPPIVRRTDGRLHGEIDLDALARTLGDAPMRGEVPRGTGQNRPVGVTSKPTSCESRTTVM